MQKGTANPNDEDISVNRVQGCLSMSLSALSVLTTFAAVGIVFPCQPDGMPNYWKPCLPIGRIVACRVCCRRPVAFWTGLSLPLAWTARGLVGDGIGCRMTLLDGLLRDHQSAPCGACPFPLQEAMLWEVLDATMSRHGLVPR